MFFSSRFLCKCTYKLIYMSINIHDILKITNIILQSHFWNIVTVLYNFLFTSFQKNFFYPIHTILLVNWISNCRISICFHSITRFYIINRKLLTFYSFDFSMLQFQTLYTPFCYWKLLYTDNSWKYYPYPSLIHMPHSVQVQDHLLLFSVHVST